MFENSDQLSSDYFIPPSYFKDCEEPEWIIEGLVARGCVTLLVATSGAGKTLLSLHLSGALLHGSQFAGLDVAKGNVFWVEQDGPPGGVKQLQNMVKVKYPKLDQLMFHSTYFNPLLTKTVYEMQRTTYELDTDVLILDSLAGIMGGDLKDDAGAIRCMAVLSHLAQKNEMGVLVLHHTHKGNHLSPEPLEERGYGSVFFKAKCDLALDMFKQKSNQRLTIVPSSKFRGFESFNRLVLQEGKKDRLYTLVDKVLYSDSEDEGEDW